MSCILDIMTDNTFYQEELLTLASHVATWISSYYAYFILAVILNIQIPFVMLYSTAWSMSWYKYRHQISEFGNKKIWLPAWQRLARTYRYFGGLWHGYEIIGLEKISWNDTTGTLFAFYHGPFSLDFPYVASEIVLHKKRMPRIVAHQMLFKFPGIQTGLQALGVFNGDYDECVRLLKEGHLVFVAPGGAYEAAFSDSNYEIMWKKRTGFARAALEAKVPIVPVFCSNIQEGFFTLLLPQGLATYLYEKFRLIIAIFFIVLPVKLRIFLGEPIPYDENVTKEELAQKVKSALEEMIQKHQRIPGRKLPALMDRFYSNPIDGAMSKR